MAIHPGIRFRFPRWADSRAAGFLDETTAAEFSAPRVLKAHVTWLIFLSGCFFPFIFPSFCSIPFIFLLLSFRFPSFSNGTNVDRFRFFPLIAFPYKSWHTAKNELPRLNEEARGYYTLPYVESQIGLMVHVIPKEKYSNLKMQKRVYKCTHTNYRVRLHLVTAHKFLVPLSRWVLRQLYGSDSMA